MNDIGEPKIAQIITILGYGMLFCLTFSIIVFFIFTWMEWPNLIRLIAVLLTCWLGTVWWMLIRCWIGKDCFCYDHPLKACILGEKCEFNGVFSKCELTSVNVKKVSYWPSSSSGSWMIIHADCHGKHRRLWFAPWFRNKDKLVSILSPVSSEAKAKNEE